MLLASQQGVKVLGIPIGKQEYVQEFLAHKTKATASALSTYPLGQRHPICVSLFVHVWRHQGKTSGCVQSDQKTQKILPDDTTRMFGRASVRSWALHMRQRQRMFFHFVIVSGRFGIGQRSSCSSRCTLGQLGRFLANGQTEGTLGPPG